VPVSERRVPPRARRSVSQADIAEIKSEVLPHGSAATPDSSTPRRAAAPDSSGPLSGAAPDSPTPRSGAPPVSPTPPPAATTVGATSAPRRRASRTGRALRYLVLASMAAAIGIWLRTERGMGSAGGEASPSPAASAAAVTAPSGPVGAATATAATERTAARTASTATAAASVSVAIAPSAVASVARPGPRGVVLFTTADSAPVSASGDAGEEVPDYDLATALKALNRVYYGDCRVPSAGQLAITFAPSGRVKKVAVVQGTYDEQTAGCLAARFGAARMPAFRGGPQTVTANLVAKP
jgi:hypothetical protein